MLTFNTTGVAAPQFNTSSPGTKILLYPNETSTTADYAIGIANNTLWNAVPGSVQQFQWYGGTTVAATLSGAGALTLTGGLTATGATVNNISVNNTLSFTGTYNVQIQGNVGATVAGVTGQLFGIAQGGVAWVHAIDTSGNVGAAGTYYSSVNGLLLSPSGQTAGSGYYQDANVGIRTSGSVYLQGPGGAGYAGLNCSTITASDTISTSGTVTAYKFMCVAMCTIQGNNNSVGVYINNIYNSGAPSIAGFYLNGVLKSYITNAGAYTVSDARVKKNIKPIKVGLATITKLNPVSYNFIDRGSPGIGLIAQEVVELLPDAVDEKENLLFMNYNVFIPILIKAIQEQQEMIDKLRAKVFA